MPDIIDLVPETHRDLLNAPLTATLTTVDAKGRPQSTAVWYMLDQQGALVSSTTSDRQKYRNLTKNPSCSLFIIDPANAHHTLEVRAEADLAHDPDKATVRALARAHGADEVMMASMPEDRWTITYRPWRVACVPPAQRANAG